MNSEREEQIIVVIKKIALLVFCVFVLAMAVVTLIRTDWGPPRDPQSFQFLRESSPGLGSGRRSMYINNLATDVVRDR